MPKTEKPEAEHQRVVLRDEEVLEHGHAGEQADVLEGAGDPRLPGDPVTRQALQKVGRAVRLPQGDHALGRLVEAGDAVEDGGLSSAVRPDQGGDVAAPRLERQVVDGDEAAEAHRQMLDREDGVMPPAHQPCPSFTREPEIALRSL